MSYISNNQIILKTTRDSNQDSLFSKSDEVIWYKATYESNQWRTHEMVDSAIRSKIEQLYFEQWLAKKK